MKQRKLLLPVSCGAIGVLWAICWGMTHRPPGTDPDRVNLDESIPLAMLGTLGGVLIGAALYQITRHSLRLIWLFEIALCSLLAGSIAAPFGWMARHVAADRTGVQSIIQTGLIGAIAGLVFRTWRRGRKAGRSPAEKPNMKSPARIGVLM